MYEQSKVRISQLLSAVVCLVIIAVEIAQAYRIRTKASHDLFVFYFYLEKFIPHLKLDQQNVMCIILLRTSGSGANTMRTFMAMLIAALISNVSYAYPIGDEAQEIINSGTILFANPSNTPKLSGATEMGVLYNEEMFICLVKEFENLVLCLELDQLDTLFK